MKSIFTKILCVLFFIQLFACQHVPNEVKPSVIISKPKQKPKLTNETFVFGGDPQYYWDVDENNNHRSKEKAKSILSSTYSRVNRLYPNATAMMINGDMTSYGHHDEWDVTEQLLDQINIPLLWGLGNHDVLNNVNDTYENNAYIRSFKIFTDNFSSMGNTSWDRWGDFVIDHGYTFPTLTYSMKGSFSYAINVSDKVTMIQLHDEPGYTDTKTNRFHYDVNGNFTTSNYISFYTDHGLSSKTWNITRYTNYYWLERQLLKARKQNRVIIFNQHRASLDNKLRNLLDKYEVNLRFAGHNHELIGRLGGWIFSGSLERGNFISVEMDYVNEEMKIYKHVNADTKVYDSSLSFKTNKNYSGWVAPNEPFYVTIKNEAGYNSFSTINYTDENNKAQQINTGTMHLGNTNSYLIPGGSKNVQVNTYYYTGWFNQYKLVMSHKPTTNIKYKHYGTVFNAQWGTY